MEQVLVSKYYLKTVKEALQGNKYYKNTCLSNTRNYLNGTDTKQIKDIRKMIKQLEDTPDKRIMLICIENLINQSKE